MNSPLKDTLVWPSPPCFQQELQTSLDNAATKTGKLKSNLQWPKSQNTKGNTVCPICEKAEMSKRSYPTVTSGRRDNTNNQCSTPTSSSSGSSTSKPLTSKTTNGESLSAL